MEKALKKEQLGAWMADLTDLEVHSPVFEDGVWNYQRVREPLEAKLDHDNTVSPPKGFILPQREVLFRFSQAPGKAPELSPTVPEPKPAVVFGVRPCDGRSRLRNDKVFGGQRADVYYQARAEKVAYVGLACNTPPSENCFCQSLGGSPYSEDGLDVLLTELNGTYHVKAVTPRGEALIAKGAEWFSEVTHEQRSELEAVRAAALEEPHRAVSNLGALPLQLKKNFDSPVWKEMAQACIGCGVCTYLCPTCHCFDMNDEVKSRSPLQGERVRTWDTCQFPDFTMHASGHNPREDLGARLRQRIAHKFLYFHENHGTTQCTGCGRCITHCPVGIDILAVMERVTQP
jgi:sulfhydrogenase subunit beta (sulfur reductase)